MTQPPFYRIMAARTWRFFDRYVDALRTDAFANDGSGYHDAEDYLHAAFQCCWHIKDWIKNDDGIDPSVRSAIDACVHTDPRLQIVRGFANGTKHLKLSTVGKHEQLCVDDSEVELHELEGGGVFMRRFFHVGQTGERIAADLALRAGMTAWNEILHAQCLPPVVEASPST